MKLDLADLVLTMADLGTLVVIVLKARNLTNKVRVGKQNPYATVTYGLTKKRTPAIVRGGQAPTWDHELHFSIPSTLQDFAGPGAAKVTATGGVGPGAGGATKPEVQAAAHMLKIACWADDARDPKLIGEAVVDLTEVLRKGEFDEWIPLAAKARPVGDVFIEMTFYRNVRPFSLSHVTLTRSRLLRLSRPCDEDRIRPFRQDTACIPRSMTRRAPPSPTHTVSALRSHQVELRLEARSERLRLLFP